MPEGVKTTLGWIGGLVIIALFVVIVFFFLKTLVKLL